MFLGASLIWLHDALSLVLSVNSVVSAAAKLAAFFAIKPGAAGGAAAMVGQLAQLKEIKAATGDAMKKWAPEKFSNMTAMHAQSITPGQLKGLSADQVGVQVVSGLALHVRVRLTGPTASGNIGLADAASIFGLLSVLRQLR